MPKRPVVGGHARKMVAKLLSHPTAKESMVKAMVQYDTTQVFVHGVVLTLHFFSYGSGISQCHQFDSMTSCGQVCQIVFALEQKTRFIFLLGCVRLKPPNSGDTLAKALTTCQQAQEC